MNDYGREEDQETTEETTPLLDAARAGEGENRGAAPGLPGQQARLLNQPYRKENMAKNYDKQKIRTTANKVRRIEKELRKNPNNTVAKETLTRLKK